MKRKPSCTTGYECGICGCYHPADWDGDCRDDSNRFPDAECFKYLIDMEDVDAWRRSHEPRA